MAGRQNCCFEMFVTKNESAYGKQVHNTTEPKEVVEAIFEKTTRDPLW